MATKAGIARISDIRQGRTLYAVNRPSGEVIPVFLTSGIRNDFGPRHFSAVYSGVQCRMTLLSYGFFEKNHAAISLREPWKLLFVTRNAAAKWGGMLELRKKNLSLDLIRLVAIRKKPHVLTLPDLVPVDKIIHDALKHVRAPEPRIKEFSLDELFVKVKRDGEKVRFPTINRTKERLINITNGTKWTLHPLSEPMPPGWTAPGIFVVNDGREPADWSQGILASLKELNEEMQKDGVTPEAALQMLHNATLSMDAASPHYEMARGAGHFKEVYGLGDKAANPVSAFKTQPVRAVGEKVGLDRGISPFHSAIPVEDRRDPAAIFMEAVEGDHLRRTKAGELKTPTEPYPEWMFPKPKTSSEE